MPVPFESLTPDEVELVRLVAAGLSEKEIAAQTSNTVKSVEGRTYRLRKKLGVTDRVDVAKLATEAGLVPLNSLTCDAPPPEILTDRQREILAMVGTGLRMKEVAARCCLSLKAATSHKDRAMHRLGLRDRVAVYHYCQMHGLIPPTE
jgi:DNA-binding NarL/FixJ family response regulator